MHYYLLFIYTLLFPFQLCISQSVEQAWDLRFSNLRFRDAAYCHCFTDSAQVTDDGFYPSQIKFVDEKENPLPNWVHLKKMVVFSIGQELLFCQLMREKAYVPLR